MWLGTTDLIMNKTKENRNTVQISNYYTCKSQFLQITIYIISAPKYRDSIDWGDSCIITALVVIGASTFQMKLQLFLLAKGVGKR